jgi:hypothetical protein
LGYLERINWGAYNIISTSVYVLSERIHEHAPMLWGGPGYGR